MKLHQDPNLFRDAIEMTKIATGLSPLYIEKDYWVCYLLKTIFSDSIGVHTVFKGGTALAKCFGSIERFSEDIDLVVIRNAKESSNQLTNKLKKISKVVNAALPELEVEGLTQKRGMNRKTAHHYPQLFTGDFGQVREFVVVESTWLGYYEPFESRLVSTYIYQALQERQLMDFAESHGLAPFQVQVLRTERTFCEKIMSLVRFSFSETPIEDLKKKIRHTYDLHMLLREADMQKFFHSELFEKMLIKVGEDDFSGYRNNNEWLKNHPKNAIIFSEIDTLWPQLKSTYLRSFQALVFGPFPTEAQIVESLKAIHRRLTDITWPAFGEAEADSNSL